MKHTHDTIGTLTFALADSPHTFGKIALPERIKPGSDDDPDAPRRSGPVARVHDAFVVFHPSRGCLVMVECHIGPEDDDVSRHRKLDRSVSKAVRVETRLRSSLQRWRLWQQRTVPMGWAVLVHGIHASEFERLDFPQWFCLASANPDTLPGQLDAVMDRFARLWRGDITHLMGDLMMSVCSEGALDGSFIPITAFHQTMHQLERVA
ncbi:MAG: hypothetical protein ACQEVA_12540 [Myxococcota bacterium]